MTVPNEVLFDGSVRDVAERLQWPKSTVFDRRAKAMAELKERAGVPIYTPQEELPSDADELLIAVADFADTLAKQRSQTELLEVSVDGESGPVAIAFTGDWHIGNIGTDYRQLYADLAALESAQDDGLYIVGMGDYGDNYKTGMGAASTGIYDAVIPNPDDQQRAWFRLLERLNPGLLGLILGCHLDWDFRSAGRDVLQGVTEKLGHNQLGVPVANLGYGGIIRLGVGDQNYEILARHRMLGDSNANTTGAQKKASMEYPVDTSFDVVALAHKHYNDLQQRSNAGKNQIWLRSGGYKIVDRYGQKLGAYAGEPGIPVVIFHPKRHELLAFPGDKLSFALETLKALRDGALEWK